MSADLLSITNKTAGVFTDPKASTDKKIGQCMEAATKLLTEIFGNAAEAARKNVHENETIANNIDKSIETQTERNNSAIEPILQQIENNKQEIIDIMDQVEGLEKEKEAINDKIAKSQEIIDENKEKFKNGNAKEKKEALKAISDESDNIRGYIEEVQALSDSQSSLNEEAENIEGNNEELNAEAVEVKEEGEDKIDALQNQSAQNKAETVALEAKAPVHEAKAVKLEAEAAALEASSSFTFGASGAKAANLRLKAQQHFSAANIIGTGVVPIFQTIVGSDQTSKTGLNILQNTITTIGSTLNDSNALAFNFFDSSNALGSDFNNMIATLTTGTDSLDKAVEKAEDKIEEETNDDKNTNKKDDEVDFDTKELEIK